MNRVGLPASLFSIALVFLCSAAASPAHGAAIVSTEVAELPGAAEKLSAYGGYVVFSQAESRTRWRLMSWHDGVVTRLNVPARRSRAIRTVWSVSGTRLLRDQRRCGGDGHRRDHRDREPAHRSRDPTCRARPG